MADADAVLARAAEIADDVFFPAALDVDRADRVPASHLDLLAAEGFYGLAAPPAGGGLGPPDLSVAGAVLAALASGCLATTFVWMQHHGAVLGAAYSDRPGVPERWVGPLSRGERRAGIALAGLRASTPMRVHPGDDGGYRLDGEIPWVTGWDMIDTLYLAARDDAGLIHYLLVDAAPAPTVTVRPLDLVAAQASRTVDLRFTGHVVPADRLAGTQPYADWAASDAPGSALNGFLALGVANRCCRLLGASPLDAELAACRTRLVSADAATTPEARADASELALRAAARLAVRTGSRSVLRDNHAQRLVREAAFLLVFGSRPAMRDALLARLTAPGVSDAGTEPAGH